MPLLLNNAGGSAADPVIEDLPLSLIGGADSLDLSQNIRAFIDQAAGTGVNEITAGLSPDPTTVFTAGTNGAFNSTTRAFTIPSTTGLSAGNYLYVDNGVTAALARIESVTNATTVVLAESVFSGSPTGVSYQVHYAFHTTFNDTGALRATSAGQINYFKFQGSDSFNNLGSNVDTIYGRLDPAGSAFIEINGGNYTGQTLTTFTPTFNLLNGWANKGGILTLELVSASGITWWDGTTAEKTVASIFAQAAASRILLAGGDGLKSATLRMRSRQGSPAFRDVTISATVDSSAPNIILNVRGR